MSAQGKISTGANAFIVLDYLYRDASNYKAFGSIWLTGMMSGAERAELIACLDGGEFFVAEQVGLPALYPLLLGYGDGPTEADHAWHTFEGFREEAALVDGATVWGETTALLSAFRAANRNWQLELSPNFDWSGTRNPV